MKKKIYKSLFVAVIAVAMAVSFQMSKANNANDLTMENVEALAMADGEAYLGTMCIGHPNRTCSWDDGYNEQYRTVYNPEDYTTY